MTYCIAPDCPQPKNALNARICATCGSKLWLRDRYRVLGALGRGGFGATFLARDQSLPGHPSCVIKQLRPTTSVPSLLEMARDLFQREANILGKIGNHPQLPRLLDYFEIAQEFYLVQEYVSGSTLQKEVKLNGPFSEVRVKRFLTEILPVVQYIHSHKIIHRDIKPANLIRREQDQQLVMIDFGAVKDKVRPPEIDHSDETALTAYAIGTPGYAPPEQMAMRPVYASDLYAIGVTCVYLLTGRSPKDLPYDSQSGELRWQDYTAVSSHFAKILQKMLNISVRDRYQMASEILQDLDLEPYLDSLSQNMAFATTASLTQEVTVVEEVPRISPPPPEWPKLFGLGRSGALAKPLSIPAQSAEKSQKPTAQSLKESYDKGYRDFSEQVFSQLDLHKQVLTGCRFTKSTFFQKPTSQTPTCRTATSATQISIRPYSKNADLTNAYLVGAKLENADLRGANLSRVTLESAQLKDANLCGADLSGATL